MIHRIEQNCRAWRRIPSHTPPRGSHRATSRQRSSGASRPSFSASLMTRSKATQAITFEWTKCRRGPRISQIPSSGRCQFDSRNSSSATCKFQASGSGIETAGRARCKVSIPRHTRRVGTAGGGIAHPHGSCALVARQPGDLVFVEAADTGDAVQDLQILGRPGHRAQQPFAPLRRLPGVTGEQQRVQAKVASRSQQNR